MKTKLEALYHTLQAQGLTPQQENYIALEIALSSPDSDHKLHSPASSGCRQSIYTYNDLQLFLNMSSSQSVSITSVQSLDYLLARDKQREKDGFPRKIRVGKMVKPSQSGDDKVVIVPTTVEEKLLHDKVRLDEEGEGDGDDTGSGEGGAGEGEEGEVIGEQPVRPEQGGQGGAGQGEGGSHDVESDAYDLGKILTEQFKLPNLKDKGK